MKPLPFRYPKQDWRGFILTAALFWDFMVYSFLGFLLEIGYAWATGGRGDRKCLLVLPLCPVYGLGACAIQLLPRWVLSRPPLLFLCGALTASVVEYLAALFYEKALGVSFWDYRELPWNLSGRVCLPFSLAWGCLSLPLVYWLHPLLAPRLSAIPLPVTWAAGLALGADMLLSCALLRRTGDRACLRWYA